MNKTVEGSHRVKGSAQQQQQDDGDENQTEIKRINLS